MIGVEEAKRIVMAHKPPPVGEWVPLGSALGRSVLARVIAPHDHPLFDCSAVDGYAFRHDPAIDRWKVVGNVAAGSVFNGPVGRGECVRLFTGAMLPADADTVVMQEFVQREADRITHSDKGLRAFANVRKRGEQVRTGDVLLQEGAVLSPAAIGLLASVGVEEVAVAVVPRVCVLVTGDEFTPASQPAPGRIFSSNDHMLQAALTHARVPCTVRHVSDDAGALQRAIEEAARDGEMIISTGGASVGDHDFVHEVVERLGATIHFHGVAQKPGKPMLFAEVKEKPFFGLPGNPRAVLVLFHEYVLPFLRAMQGVKDPWPESDRLPITHAVTVKGERAEFRAAQVEHGRVTLLADEGSHMLRSLIEADALAYIPASMRAYRVDDPIEVHYLPR